jgi:hypothetical protein
LPISMPEQSRQSPSRGENLSSQYAERHDPPERPPSSDSSSSRRERSVPVARPGAGRELGGGGGGGGGEGRCISGDDQCIASADVLTHISDSQVKPIVNNRAIETIEKHAGGGGRGSALHFQTMTLEQLAALPQAKIESHLSQVR